MGTTNENYKYRREQSELCGDGLEKEVQMEIATFTNSSYHTQL